MSLSFWVRRFLTVLCGAFVVICVAQLLRGHDLTYSSIQGLIWSLISACIFTGSRIYQSKHDQHCAVCKDTPEMQQQNGRTGA
jgi:hypothetical protein